jgi:hypothetical protein
MEAQKRFDLAEHLAADLRSIAKGIVLVGSVAHSPEKVTAKSDLDLIVVVDDLYSVIDEITKDLAVRTALQNRFFDGYCVKRTLDEVSASIHFLSDDAFDIISKCNVADIRVYRANLKSEDYKLFGFEGQSYNYWIKNVGLRELPGARTIVPVSFINNDRYFIGIHRDKLLSKPRILYDSQNTVSTRIDKLWRTMARNLIAESNRLYGAIDLDKMNILNALSRKDKMSGEAKQFVIERTQKYIAQLR